MQISDEDVRLVLSQNIKSARSSIGYTQEKLAEESEISSNFLKDIEKRVFVKYILHYPYPLFPVDKYIEKELCL